MKYAAGIPARVISGKGYPLSLYYAALAIFLSSVTVPLGFWAGAKIRALEAKSEEMNQRRKLRNLTSPATLILCLVIILFIRLAQANNIFS